MKAIYGVRVIESVDDILHTDDIANEFYSWSGEKDGDFINEPERAARCYDAASYGGDGKFHWEAIEDFREFGTDLLRDAEHEIENDYDADDLWDTNPSAAEAERDRMLSELEECRAAFDKDCNELEQWHIDHGSYEQQIG